MSADYSTKLVRDARLNDVSSQLEVAVSQGANQNTFQQFIATSSSSSNLSFNIQPPSESIVVNRNILLSARVNFKINIGPNVPVGTNVWQYGQREAFQAFPLNNLFTTATATVNNTSVSVNTIDVLPALLQLMDEEDLAKCKGMSPYILDRFQNYSDAINANNNPLAGFKNASYNQHRLPRGSHPLDSLQITRTLGGGGTDANPVSGGVGETWEIDVSATFTEPLFLSPFLFHSKYNEAGLLGINTMNFVFNIDAQMKRFWSSGLAKTGAGGNAIPYTLSLNQADAFTNPRILLNFLTSQQTNLLPARNITPYVDYPRYITSQQNTNVINAGNSADIVINNIQLNQIPDRFVIVARKRLSDQGARDANAFFRINTISVNFNNASGLLSSATPQDLWRMSVASGSKQSWYDFSGKAQVYDQPGGNVQISTCGSVLVIDPSRDLSLPAFLSNGSLGQFQFQMNMNVTNIGNEDLAPEVLVITANSGLFATIAGSSQVQTALLNKEMVVDTSTQDGADAISSNEYNRMRGGALSDQIASAMKHMLIMAKKYLCGKSRSGGESYGMGRSGGMPVRNKLDSLVM